MFLVVAKAAAAALVLLVLCARQGGALAAAERANSVLGEVAKGLKNIYGAGRTFVFTTVADVVRDSGFVSFGHVNIASDAYFDSLPLVVVGGQFSTGKTTFIQDLLLGNNYSGSDVRPDPSTAHFTVLMHESTSRDVSLDRVSGESLIRGAQLPFQAYAGLGRTFLSKLVLVRDRSDALKRMTVLDTPGILAAEYGRDYDQLMVWRTLIKHADLVLLLFDMKSADIAPAFADVLNECATHDDKVLLLLNKADALEPFQLLRVNGGLMWQLGRIFRRPEALRFHVGSFRDAKCQAPPSTPDFCATFRGERERVMERIGNLPRTTALGRVSQFHVFLKELSVHLEVLRQLRAVDAGWFWCSGFDKSGRNLDADGVLELHIERLSAQNRWGPAVAPDAKRFANQVRILGGVCNMPRPTQSQRRAIERAQEALDELMVQLGEPKPKAWLNAFKWGGGSVSDDDDEKAGGSGGDSL
jgi:EH domain-containing protein 1